MLFLNTLLLAGLGAVLIPIIIHLLNRRSAKVIEWGAMRFLVDSVISRSRRIQLEEALLLACRILFFALIALAMARPFVQAGSNIPWVVVLPLMLIGIVGFGISFVIANAPKWRRGLFWGGLGIFALCAGLIALEKVFDLNRFGRGVRRDIAIIIDGSSSMALQVDGQSNFERAVEEARAIVLNGGSGNAYTVILGGPTPNAKTDAPVTSRATLDELFDGLKPVHGAMNAYDALTLAALSLAQGYNPGKQIIVLTDGQKLGWETDSPARWKFLTDALKHLPTEPQLIVRNFELPANIRNVAVAGVSYSRDVVGIDRPVTLSVTVENTGTEAVTPSGIKLSIGETVLEDKTLGQLVPGAKETIRFSHHFKKAGSHAVSAEVQVEDELPEDNRFASAINVVGRLKVLIVDGNPSARFIEQGAAALAVAMAPSRAVARTRAPELKENEFLIEPEVLAANKIISRDRFDEYHAVILADVPRLPAHIADALGDFVEAGGGLLVAPGRRAEPEFYNGWLRGNGQALLPAQMQEQVAAVEGDEIKPALSTFAHKALEVVALESQSDLHQALIQYYWKLSAEAELDETVDIGARLNNGDPFFTARKVGRGNVMMTALSLDLRGSSIAVRQSFVPFVHELVYFLANPSGLHLNLDPAWELNLALNLHGLGGLNSGQGLNAVYFNDPDFRQRVMTRIDPKLHFEWGGNSPDPRVNRDNFSVQWSGVLVPRFSEDYKFEWQSDDDFQMTIDGKRMVHGGTGGHSPAIRLQAGRRHKLEASFKERSGEAYVRLWWYSANQPHEIIPASRFLAFANAEDEGGKVLASFDCTAPDGSVRSADILRGPDGMRAVVKGEVRSGLYRIHVPEKERQMFGSMLSAAGEIPFTVKADTRESVLEQLTGGDYAFVREHVDLLQPKNADQVVQIMAGKSFGEELWKYLAVAALLFALAETALSRWIAIQRMVNEEDAIDFQAMKQPSRGFQEQLAKVKTAAR